MAKLIDKSNAPKPATTYTRDRIFTGGRLSEPAKRKYTSIRCTTTVSAQLNALVNIGAYDSINDLLGILIEDHLRTIDDSRRREYEVVLSVYKRQNNKNK